jgi:peptidoglycan/xylan/chitin deacetylase (PgdA/CDA1 family)
VGDISLKGVNYILNVEKEFNVKATYNIVGKLMRDKPDVVRRILSEGHELASHSYDHKIMADQSFDEVCSDVSKTIELFKEFGSNLRGFRSPQGKWSFKQMKALLKEGLIWSAERDNAKIPYILLRSTSGKLIRMPVKMDDWEYISKNLKPYEMINKLLKTVDHIVEEKAYGAIGFHPWVQGADDDRLLIFREFIKAVSQKQGLKILTFGEMSDLVLNSGRL